MEKWRLILSDLLWQNHPGRRLKFAWQAAQMGLLTMPFLPTVGGISFALALLTTGKQKFSEIIQNRVNQGFAVLGLGLIMTACVAQYPGVALLGLGNFLPFFLFFATLSTLIQTPEQLRQFSKLFVIASIPVVILGLGQLWANWSTPAPLSSILGWVLQANGNPPTRMASTFMYANILASYLLLVFSLGLGLWCELSGLTSVTPPATPGWKTRQWWGLTGILLGVMVAIVLTHSRNGWGLMLGVILAYGLYFRWYQLWLGVMAVAGAILGAAFAPEPVQTGLRYVVPGIIWQRLTDQNFPNRPVATLRVTQWQFAWEMTQQRPLTGWGLRNFTPLYEQQMEIWLGHPHNLILMLTAETGIPATLFFLGLVGWIYGQGVWLLPRLSPQNRLILLSYLVAFGAGTLFNLVDITLFDLRMNTFNWLLLAAIHGIVKTHPQNGWEAS